LLVTVWCRFFSKTAFSRESVACKECARFFALPVQNLLGFAAPRTRPSGYGKRGSIRGRRERLAPATILCNAPIPAGLPRV